MDENRRSFLTKAGYTALGLGCGFPLLGAAHSALRQGAEDGASSRSQLAMIVDVQKCLQEEVRDACIRACHEAHNVPFIPDAENPQTANAKEEVKWIWSENYEDVFPDQVHGRRKDNLQESPIPVLTLCNHCTDPSCVRVCPTGATWKRDKEGEDGVVMMDMHRCIGCRYCMAACPYGARSFNWRDPRERDENGKFLYFENNELPSDYPTRTIGVVEKCTFCAERLRDGRLPACVEAAAKVPGGEGALTFGDLSDDDSDVSQILRERHTIARRVSLGTGPNVFYIV